MGHFYTNITLPCPSRERIAEELQKFRTEAFLSPVVKGITVVFDERSEEREKVLEDLGASLSRALECSALAVGNYDDDLLFLGVYQDGSCKGRYAWVDSLDLDADLEPLNTDEEFASFLCEAFDAGGIVERVRALLKTNPKYDETSFLWALRGYKADLIMREGKEAATREIWGILCRRLGTTRARELWDGLWRDPRPEETQHTWEARFAVEFHQDLVDALDLNPYAVGAGFRYLEQGTAWEKEIGEFIRVRRQG